MVVLVATFSISTRNIILFGIQDHLKSPLSGPFALTGNTYAAALACLLVFGAIFLGFIIFERSRLIQNEEIFYTRRRAFWLSLGFYFSCFLILIVLVHQLIVLLNGETRTRLEIFEMALDLVILGLTALFFLLETHAYSWVRSRFYAWTVIGGTVAFMILGFAVTMHYASPSLVKKARQEVEHANALSQIKWKAQAFFKQHQRFPATLSELAALHPKEHFAKHQNAYRYTLKGKNALEVSVPFSTALQVRRHLQTWGRSNDTTQAVVEIRPAG